MPHIEAKFVISSPDLKRCPPETLVEIAFMGRSNVGKSSMINSVCNQKKLVKTSATPGKTRLINFFHIEFKDGERRKEFHFVDLPGFGHAQVSKRAKQIWEKNLSKYIEQRHNLALVVLLVDMRHKPQTIDLQAQEWLEHLNIPYIVVATKADKLNQKDKSKQTKVLKEAYKNATDFIIFSTEKRLGIKEFWQFIDESIELR